MAEVVATREKPLFSWKGFRRKGERADPAISLDAWANWFSYMGMGYMLNPSNAFSYANQKQEQPTPTFEGFAAQMFKSNPIVYACIMNRMLLFGQARLMYQRMRNGKPGDLWGDATLQLLETPWVDGTMQDLLGGMMQNNDLAGNAFIARLDKNTLTNLRPDWVTIVMGSKMNPDEPGFGLDARVIGYAYQPGGPSRREKPVPLLPEQVAHWCPIKDPMARFRGMSWLTPVVREVMADSAAQQHKLQFFENGATPNLAVAFDTNITPEAFEAWQEKFKDQHEGVFNAYKTLFLGGGASYTVVGANMRQISFKETQGAGETRIAAAAGVPPIVVGLSEGLEAATYSNYQLAMRRFVDLTMIPLWESAALTLNKITDCPSDSRLWYDADAIPALHEDLKKEAEIQQTDAYSVKALIDAGFEALSARDAIVSKDWSKLKHTGLFSVQMQPPGEGPSPEGVDGAGNPDNTPAVKPPAVAPAKPNGAGTKESAELLKEHLERNS